MWYAAVQMWIFNMTVDAVKGIAVPDTVTLEYLRNHICTDEACLRQLFATVHKDYGKFIFTTGGTSPPILEDDYVSPEAVKIMYWLAVRRCSQHASCSQHTNTMQ